MQEESILRARPSARRDITFVFPRHDIMLSGTVVSAAIPLVNNNLSVPKLALLCKTTGPIEHVLNNLLDAWQLEQPYCSYLTGSSHA